MSDVFEYIARRVVRQWEYEERLEARQMLFWREASDALGAAGGAKATTGVTLRLGFGERTGGCCG